MTTMMPSLMTTIMPTWTTRKQQVKAYEKSNLPILKESFYKKESKETESYKLEIWIQEELFNNFLMHCNNNYFVRFLRSF